MIFECFSRAFCCISYVYVSGDQLEGNFIFGEGLAEVLGNFVVKDIK